MSLVHTKEVACTPNKPCAKPFSYQNRPGAAKAQTWVVVSFNLNIDVSSIEEGAPQFFANSKRTTMKS